MDATPILMVTACVFFLLWIYSVFSAANTREEHKQRMAEIQAGYEARMKEIEAEHEARLKEMEVRHRIQRDEEGEGWKGGSDEN